MRISGEENWKKPGYVWKLEFWTYFLNAESTVKCCQVFIGNQMRGWSGCLTFGPAHPLSPVTPPRGALRPVTSSRPRHRCSHNSVQFISLIKAHSIPTFQPFWGIRIFIGLTSVLQLCMRRCPKKICKPAWNSSLNHNIRCHEQKYSHLKKSPHSVDGDKNLFRSS